MQSKPLVNPIQICEQADTDVLETKRDTAMHMPKSRICGLHAYSIIQSVILAGGKCTKYQTSAAIKWNSRFRQHR